jgi:hypothetical protein
MSLAEDEHPVGDVDANGADEPLGVSVSPWALGVNLHRRDAAVTSTASNPAVYYTSPVLNQNGELRSPVAEVHERVTRGPSGLGLV